MPCDVTFSRTRPAAVAIPEHGVEVGKSYWASDQEFPDENGNPVRLIGHRFLQSEDEDDGVRPPRFAGNAYLSFLSCLSSGAAAGCNFGACPYDDDCCDETTFAGCLLLGGQWQGIGSACPPADAECIRGSCCTQDPIFPCIDNISEGICALLPGGQWSLQPCVDEGGVGRCVGACCAEEQCFDGVTLQQCNDLCESGSSLCQWNGAGSTCDNSDCAAGACCNVLLGCYQATGTACVSAGGFFAGFGVSCGENTCAGACCLGEGGTCEDVTAATDCPVDFGSYLGPGTSCAKNSNECGVCCVPILDGGGPFPDDGSKDPGGGAGTTDFECIEGLTVEECEALCGQPLGPGSTCPDSCVSGDLIGCCCQWVYVECDMSGNDFGACCFGDICLPAVPSAECTNGGGVFKGGPCFPDPCGPFESPCSCRPTFTDCSQVPSPAVCTSAGGVWRGFCNGFCPECCDMPPTGACCCPGPGTLTWTCAETLAGDCTCKGGQWAGTYTRCLLGGDPVPDGFPSDCRIDCPL